MSKLNQFAALLKGVRKTANGIVARCPAHEDAKQSLSVTNGDGKLLVNCFTGCGLAEIAAATGWEVKDFFDDAPPGNGNGNGKHHNYTPRPLRGAIIKAYRYTDETGTLLYENVRYANKDFQYRRPDGKGGYIYGLAETRRVPYRLPSLCLLQGQLDPHLWLCEGEKDADNVRELGFVTSNFKNWREEFAPFVAGCHVTLCLDHDQPGHEQARRVAALLLPVAKSVRLLDFWPDEPLPPKNGRDVSDWLRPQQPEAAAEALAILSAMAPLYTAQEAAIHGNSAPPDAGADTSTVIRVQCAADVEPEAIRWFWQPYLAAGKFGLLTGDEGIGKSWLTCALAAAVSRAGFFPGDEQRREPANVLLFAAEDGLADTIRPRLDACGADVTRIHVADHPFVLDNRGFAALADLIGDLKPALVVVDPLFAYVGGRLDLNQDNANRTITSRLADTAQRFGCVILGVRHVGKARGGGEARAAGLGGIGWRAAARSELLVGLNPDNPRERVIVQTKNNLTMPGVSLAYTIDENGFGWLGASTVTAQQLLQRRTSYEVA